MSNPDQILIRRLSVKPQTVKKGLFSSETKFVLDGAMNDGERLFRVCADDAVEELDAENLPCAEGLRVFAVQCDPFTLSFLIDLGRERDNYRWDLSLVGKARIADPIAFLHEYYSDAKEVPFTVKSFVDALGTRPENLLLDRILHESMGVLSINDVNVDIAQWTKERNLTEDAFTSAFREKKGTPLGEGGAVAFAVNAVRFFSEELEAARAAQIADDGERIKQDRQKAAKSAEREEELERKRHELKLAELDAQMNKLKVGTTESAFAAFEVISNFLGDAVSKSGASQFADILKCARRAESGLRLLALARDKKRAGGVTLSKNAPSFQTRCLNFRSLAFVSKKTPALHCGESLSSTITCGRSDGWLTVLNVSERNEVIPILPNEDFPSVRVVRGQGVLIGDDASEYVLGISETASSGTDHLIAIVSDAPLLDAPLPPLGGTLPVEKASELAEKLEAMDPGTWAADAISFTVLP